METTITLREREGFGERLTASIIALGSLPTASFLAREFNLRAANVSVTVHAARKWLVGDAFPTQERLHVLSRWLNVSPLWLRYGEGPKDARVAANDSVGLAYSELNLLNDIRKLDDRSKQILRDLVESLLKSSLRS